MALADPGAMITQRLSCFEKLQGVFQPLSRIIVMIVARDKKGEMGDMGKGHGRASGNELKLSDANAAILVWNDRPMRRMLTQHA